MKSVYYEDFFQRKHVISLTYFTILDGSPLEVLYVDGNSEKGGKEDNSFQAVFLTLIVLRFRSPRKERHNVFCHLASCGRSAYV